MRHTVFTDYCLRVLMFVGVRGEKLATIDEISRTYGISRNHLMKVVNRLGNEGYVETIRGRSGGIRLAREPKSICIGELVARMEDDFHLVECFNQTKNKCILTPACRLGPIMGEALNAYLEVLNKYTLADLLEKQPAVHQILAKAI